MSRFFHGPSSSSEDESDYTESISSDESSLSSSSLSATESERDEPVEGQTPAGRSTFSKFMKGDGAHGDDSDDEDSGKRVVLSAKDKAMEELRSTVKLIDANRVEADNWSNVQMDFDKLMKLISKFQSLLFKNSAYPPFLLKCIVDLEVAVTALADDKEARKKLNAADAKAVTVLKQKIRKQISGTSLETALEKFKADPSTFADDDRDMSSDGDSDEDSDESVSDAEEKSVKKETGGASKWKKATPSAFAKTPASTAAAAKKKEKKVVTISADDKAAKAKSEEPVFTTENLYQKLREIRDLRGKKGTDRQEMIRTIEKILAVAVTPIQRARVLMTMISAKFDVLQSTPLSFDLWKGTESDITQLFDIIEINSDIIVSASVDEFDEEKAMETTKDIQGDVVSLVSRLDTEYGKCLQASDPNASEYVDRLKEEILLYALILRAENYLLSHQENKDSLVLVRTLRLEHVYYKYNNLIVKIEEVIRQKHAVLKSLQAANDADTLVHDLCVYLYQNSSQDRIRTRAILYHVYHHALNKRYTQARDLLLMSRLQDSITKADISTQVLYNRALAQIGICAFRSGLLKECHSALSEMVGSLKQKDLLAQGTQAGKQYAVSEAERKDKHTVLPIHMHINLELLEAIQLTVAMLLDIPLLALHAQDSRRRNISKHFKRLYDFGERQTFTGPPESTRDHIMHASRAFAEGEWKKTIQLLTSMKIWNLMPDVEAVKNLLTEHVKKGGLKTYLVTFGYNYKQIGIKQLASLFNLPEETIVSNVSRLILDDELFASIDMHNKVITMNQNLQSNRLEYLVSVLGEKGTIVTDFNEKFYEILTVQQKPGGQQKQSQQQGQYRRNFTPSQSHQHNQHQPTSTPVNVK